MFLRLSSGPAMAALPLFVLGLGGCTPIPEAKSCASAGECDPGQDCIDAVCTDVECRTAADCGIQEYCTSGGACAPGCDSDGDCFAGQTCDLEQHTCESYGCRDTQLDCNYNEFCDQTTGQCVASGMDNCGSCNPESASCGGGGACLASEEQGACNSFDYSCPSGQGCFIAETDERRTCEDWLGLPDDSVCPSGWSCGQTSATDLNLYCFRPACFTGECYAGCDSSSDDPCPRGFSCVDAGTTDVCFADCAFLRDGGYL